MAEILQDEFSLNLNVDDVNKKLDTITKKFLQWMGTADLTFSKQEQNTVQYGFKIRELAREYDKVNKAIDGFNKLSQDAANVGDTTGQMEYLGNAQELVYKRENLLDQIRLISYNMAKDEKTGDNGGILSNVFSGDGMDLLKTLTGGVSDIAGVSDTMIDTGLDLVGGLVAEAGAVTAATAAIKIIIELLKSKYERDKLDARIESLAGTEAAKTGREWAQAAGFKDSSKFGGVYADMLETFNGDVATAIDVLNSAYVAGYGQEKAVLEAAKNIQTMFVSGSGSLQNVYGNANYMTNKVMSAGFGAYAKTGNVSAILNAINNYGNRYGYSEATEKIDELGMTKFIKGVNKLTNSAKDIVMSSDGYSQNQNSLGNNGYSNTSRIIPVQVTNSIMLSKQTIDEMTELKTKQWIANVNMEHTTPMYSININTGTIEGNITAQDLAVLTSDIMKKNLMEQQVNGSHISEAGGYY